MMMYMVMIMMIFYRMADRQKALCLISSLDHSWRLSPSQTLNMLQAVFEPTHSMSTDLVEWSCAVLINTTTQHQLVTSFRLYNSPRIIFGVSSPRESLC